MTLHPDTDMNQKNTESFVITLPRGGYLVETSSGYIQFGAPPETIKDTMTLPGGVPRIFVLPERLFNPLKGISIAEMEFPLYYNFFVKKQRTTVICSEKQADQIRAVLHESLFGPEDPDFTLDYNDYLLIPDLSREFDYFRTMQLDDVVTFVVFTGDQACVDGLTVRIDQTGDFILEENGSLVAHVPGIVEYKARYSIGKRPQEPYLPPLFGLTCLGASSGFDPNDNTSGFILWINHHGIMIDPPVNTTEWLLDSNVSPKFIDSIILTHCHADHDAGTMQKILEEQRITLYTTETVLESFLRKYSAFTGFPESYLHTLFAFQAVKIDLPMFIHGATFNFFYTLHSIPTIGFTSSFQGKTIVYSSDHNNNPALHRELLEKGIISADRYRELSSFPWNADLIYHESGMAPLHTPLTCLTELPEDIQERIIVYHIPDASMPEKTLLTHARFGIENTRILETTPPPFEGAYQLMSLFRNMDFFRHMSITDAQDFMANVQEKHYNKGDVIIEAGSCAEEFFMIHHGNVSILDSDGNIKKIFGTYDYFGETALVKNNPRSATVMAETEVLLYTIAKEKFLHFVRGTEYESIIIRLAENRDREVWELFSLSPALRICTPTQKTWLESMLEPESRTGAGVLVREGEEIENIHLLRKGLVQVEKKGRILGILESGGLIGSVSDLYSRLPSSYTFTHKGDLSLYTIKKKAFLRFLENNPGLIIKLAYGFREKEINGGRRA